VAEGLLQGGPPGGQVLDPVLGQELGVAVEERLVVWLVLEPLVELEELVGLLEVALLVEAVVEEELAVSQMLLVKTN
jgi:hypothetical protein